jgi:hypothetical protein
VLPAYNSIVEQSKVNVQKYLEDLKNNQSRIDAIREKMTQVGVEAVVEEYKTKFATEFPIKLKKHFEEKLSIIKTAVGDYPKFLNDINYSAITESVVLSSSKLADSWTGLSWFNRYQDPNDAIQDIALLFEETVQLDGYTNKENPFMMLVGSLIYLCINECCIEMPELIIIEGTLPAIQVNKMQLPGRGMKIPPMQLPNLKLELVESTIVISGAHKERELHSHYLAKELYTGHFYRRYPINPKLYDTTAITSKAVNGFLIVRIPYKIVNKSDRIKTINIQEVKNGS